MNISTPFPSQIRSVDFGFLTRSEIRKLSVKRIVHTEAINPELGFPNPGGLYDQALGSREDFPCTTCNLEHLCPGHVGHIELPQPVYHPVFMDQLIKLLNFQCGCCWRFRLGVDELHAYACRLKLLSYGLVKEAHDIGFIDVRKPGKQTNGVAEGESTEDIIDDDDRDVDNVQSALINARNKYLAHAIKKNGGKKYLLANPSRKVGVLVEERRKLIKELFRALARDRQCQHCKGYSPTYRKDGFNKIFRQPLSEKHRMQNIQTGMKPKDPILERAKTLRDKRAKKKKQHEAEDDEGIAMEVDDLSEEDTDGGEPEDTTLNTGSLLDTAAMSGSAEVKKSSNKKDNQVYITPSMALASLEELFHEEKEVLGLLYQSRPTKAASQEVGPDMFFMTDILVTPNRFRPEMRQGTGMITEASQNKSYSNILSASIEFNDARRLASGSQQGSPQFQRGIYQMQQSLIKMQDMVNSLIDSDKNGSARASLTAPQGVKQLLEKKEGLFRMNMMGKRVNFAARSVISPDPNIEPNEIGVPPVFAKKLTYPEPVTSHNFYEMKQAVLNGPDTWPGAAAIENESGQVVNLKYKNLEERQALANQLLAPSSTNVSGARNKRVHRHLNNGDIVIMNRQPTLHKPSMMCHRARVLPGEKTIRMHYANCNTYNADFDGDEMNMHFPQNEAARAEAILIADTNHQYLSGTAGKPLRGLIQDHLSMSVWLSNKDTFFDRADYHQLLYSCLRPEKTGVNIQTVPPAVIKPRALWTGKQLVTTILKNIQPSGYPGLTMTGKSSVPEARWQDPDAPKDKLPTEGQVLFKHGEFMCGILDKAQLGPAKGGFIHSVYEVYGEAIAGSLLGILGRMLTKLEHMRAFSCGMEDIVLTKSGNQKRRQLLEGSIKVGHEVATKYVSLDSSARRDDSLLMNRLEDVLRDDKKQQGLDTVYNSRTAELSSNITKGCLPGGLFKPFPRNQMQTMTVSGAKGSAVNANLISCNLGQQVLEGRRTPTMVSGKTLPAFKPFETAVRAGGYITNRFLTGVQPQEYYFHTMAGREGLIDTAVKTSRSGYLQRCIIKGMEGLQVEYDTTVRDSDGSVVQFLYGEDGLDVTKQVQLSNFKFQAENWMSAAQKYKVLEANPDDWKEDVAEANQKAIRKAAKTNNLGASVPVLSDHNPSSVWGATSEKFAGALKHYIKKNPDGLIKDKKTNPNGDLPKKQFQMLLEMMYMRSVIEPGEPVGIVAGQSIGEPSTQMTLNTFHLAGHSAKNVTLGIPRLREIVMTATANLATPQMRLYFNEEVSQEEGETFAKALTKRTVAEVVDDIVVTERVGKGVGFAQAKIYDVRLNFFPAKEYRDEYAFTEEELAFAVEAQLIPILERVVRKEIKDKGLAKSGKSKAQPIVGKSYGASESAKATREEEDSAQKENDRTEDALSEESDDDDEDDEDKHNQEANAYGDDEDDRKIAQKAREESMEPEKDASGPPHEDEGYGGSPREGDDDNSDEEGDIATGKEFGPGDVSPEMAQQRAERIVSASTNSVFKFKWDVGSGSWCQFSLEYDSSTEKILMLHLVERACRKAVVQYITNILSATLDKDKIRDNETGGERDVTVLIVEGNNLTAMHQYQNVVDPHQMFTNDIVAMMKTYGVEAGRATIIREMDAVFKGHSIDVDNRHLNLIADHMTRNGDFLAFSRTGMRTGVSPFAKMSFETTVGFLKDAVMEQDFDDLSGPSARIVTGRVGKVGTGAFDVFTPVSV